MTSWSRYLFIALSILLLLLGVRAVSLTAESQVPVLRGTANNASLPSSPQTPTARQADLRVGESRNLLPVPLLDQLSVSIAATSPNPAIQTAVSSENSVPSADCFQMLANSQLDVVELGDNTGSVEPWVIIDQNVYYFTRDDEPPFPNYYLYMEDQDALLSDTTTPFWDSFGQAIFMPDDLESIEIQYDVLTLQSNPDDLIFGEVWLLDLEGNDHEILGDWEILDSEDEWVRDTVGVPSEFFPLLEGQPIGIILVTVTDNTGAAERVQFDNIVLTACVKSAPVSGNLFLPSVLHVANTGPVCVPPSESPRDEVGANRGLVQTGALCQTTMSQLDTQDYYTFRPQQGGNYTLQLRNLPPNTEWSGSIIQNSGGTFEYAPGPTGGQCRIATPGAGNKQVTCNLQGGREYVVKVSAGGYSGPEADYEMRVMR